MPWEDNIQYSMAAIMARKKAEKLQNARPPSPTNRDPATTSGAADDDDPDRAYLRTVTRETCQQLRKNVTNAEEVLERFRAACASALHFDEFDETDDTSETGEGGFPDEYLQDSKTLLHKLVPNAEDQKRIADALWDRLSEKKWSTARHVPMKAPNKKEATTQDKPAAQAKARSNLKLLGKSPWQMGIVETYALFGDQYMQWSFVNWLRQLADAQPNLHTAMTVVWQNRCDRRHSKLTRKSNASKITEWHNLDLKLAIDEFLEAKRSGEDDLSPAEGGDEDRREEEPNREEPNGEEPSGDEPGGDEPREDESNGNEPSEDESSEDEFSEDKPSEDKPSEDKPSEDKPSEGEPRRDEPSQDDYSKTGSSRDSIGEGVDTSGSLSSGVSPEQARRHRMSSNLDLSSFNNFSQFEGGSAQGEDDGFQTSFGDGTEDDEQTVMGPPDAQDTFTDPALDASTSEPITSHVQNDGHKNAELTTASKNIQNDGHENTNSTTSSTQAEHHAHNSTQYTSSSAHDRPASSGRSKLGPPPARGQQARAASDDFQFFRRLVPPLRNLNTPKTPTPAFAPAFPPAPAPASISYTLSTPKTTTTPKRGLASPKMTAKPASKRARPSYDEDCDGDELHMMLPSTFSPEQAATLIKMWFSMFKTQDQLQTEQGLLAIRQACTTHTCHAFSFNPSSKDQDDSGGQEYGEEKDQSHAVEWALAVLDTKNGRATVFSRSSADDWLSYLRKIDPSIAEETEVETKEFPPAIDEQKYNGLSTVIAVAALGSHFACGEEAPEQLVCAVWLQALSSCENAVTSTDGAAPHFDFLARFKQTQKDADILPHMSPSQIVKYRTSISSDSSSTVLKTPTSSPVVEEAIAQDFKHLALSRSKVEHIKTCLAESENIRKLISGMYHSVSQLRINTNAPDKMNDKSVSDLHKNIAQLQDTLQIVSAETLRQQLRDEIKTSQEALSQMQGQASRQTLQSVRKAVKNRLGAARTDYEDALETCQWELSVFAKGMHDSMVEGLRKLQELQ
ncbi:Hypothetical predicted protein [Lecanosticta acicola]|uniref:Uncharacterized protein n=1 Tax=Lecanosticta acicola TaxID=111012 RepID=A0AAI8Z9R5_9PEZI|nr:Hypothetical predicted protein [Lecanosticta acicola]